MINGELILRIVTEISSYPYECIMNFLRNSIFVLIHPPLSNIYFEDREMVVGSN
jgi:hypothetical protein